MRYVVILLIINIIASCGMSHRKGEPIIRVKQNDSFPDPAEISKLKLTNALQYRRWIERLDPVDLASLDTADTLFTNCLADTLSRDSMFVVYNEFLNHLAEIYLENNEKVSDQLGNSPSSEIVSSLKAMFAAHGMVLWASDGSFYLEPQTKLMLQKFGPVLSDAYREFLTIGKREQETRFARDGRILIPADSLITRILNWENFMNRYPGFISIKTVQEKYGQYLGAYLAGMDNSRAFDKDTDHLKDSLKESFESFVEKNPESKSALVVKEYLEMLKSTDFNYTDKVDSFLLEKAYH